MNALEIKALKTLVHTLGRLSGGIRIARRDGLTSGRMLDYVYRNEPSGAPVVGRFLDRIYLSNKAWRAVRIRKRHLTELLEWAIRRQLEACGEAFILDVASGQARYLLDVLGKFLHRKVESLCWDLDERWRFFLSGV